MVKSAFEGLSFGGIEGEQNFFANLPKTILFTAYFTSFGLNNSLT
jgi:hypothetical protein